MAAGDNWVQRRRGHVGQCEGGVDVRNLEGVYGLWASFCPGGVVPPREFGAVDARGGAREYFSALDKFFERLRPASGDDWFSHSVGKVDIDGCHSMGEISCRDEESVAGCGFGVCGRFVGLAGCSGGGIGQRHECDTHDEIVGRSVLDNGRGVKGCRRKRFDTSGWVDGVEFLRSGDRFRHLDASVRFGSIRFGDAVPIDTKFQHRQQGGLSESLDELPSGCHISGATGCGNDEPGLFTGNQVFGGVSTDLADHGTPIAASQQEVARTEGIGACEPVHLVSKSKRKNQRKRQARKAKSFVSSFSGCDENLVKELATSRAKRFVAENEAARVRASRFVAADNPYMSVLSHCERIMNCQRKIAKLSGSSNLSGWAKTLADGAAEEFATSVSSTSSLSKVPSLDSVKLGSSCTASEEEKKSTQVQLYLAAKAKLEESFANRDSYTDIEFESAFGALTDQFAEFLFTPKQDIVRRVVDRIIAEGPSLGLTEKQSDVILQSVIDVGGGEDPLRVLDKYMEV